MSAVRLLGAIAFLFAICGCLRGPTGPQELSAIPYLSALEIPPPPESARRAQGGVLPEIPFSMRDFQAHPTGSDFKRLLSQTKDRLFIAL